VETSQVSPESNLELVDFAKEPKMSPILATGRKAEKWANLLAAKSASIPLKKKNLLFSWSY
jgi:hypothetical protein